MSDTVIGPIRGGSLPWPVVSSPISPREADRYPLSVRATEEPKPRQQLCLVPPWFLPARILRLLPVPRFDVATAIGDLSFQWSHRLDIA